nr:unnamed protein product [Spirometra erinaceieuropaei]
MIRQLHDEMIASVTVNRTVSESLAVTNGVKQGCVIAPTRFILMLLPCWWTPTEIRIAYRPYAHLLKSRRLQVLTATVRDLLFADDSALNTATDTDMQRSICLFAPACAKFWLTINTDKTVVIHQAIPNAARSVSRIYVNSTKLNTVDNFACVGSILSCCLEIDDEVAYRILKASQSFNRLK